MDTKKIVKSIVSSLFLPAAIALLLSCKKENDNAAVTKPATELLIQKPWILASHGYDDNQNNIVDPSEDGIEDCQKDNIIHFFADGTGLADENILSCANGIEKNPFSWAFINNETGIDFLHDTVKLLRLTEQELALCKELDYSNGDTVKFILIYKH